jgi:hypothetical protein
MLSVTSKTFAFDAFDAFDALDAFDAFASPCVLSLMVPCARASERASVACATVTHRIQCFSTVRPSRSVRSSFLCARLACAMSKAKRVTTQNGVDALAMSPNVRARWAMGRARRADGAMHRDWCREDVD